MSLIESLKNWMKKKKFSRKNEPEHWLVWGSPGTGLQQVIDLQRRDMDGIRACPPYQNQKTKSCYARKVRGDEKEKR